MLVYQVVQRWEIAKHGEENLKLDVPKLTQRLQVDHVYDLQDGQYDAQKVADGGEDHGPADDRFFLGELCGVDGDLVDFTSHVDKATEKGSCDQD